jgi:hypothetical protein
MKIKEIFCWVLFALAVLMTCISYFGVGPRDVVLSVYWVVVTAYWAYSAWELEKNH